MPQLILAFLSKLRFRTLFLVTATIFLVDLLIPDLIPFVDELLLGAGTLLLAAWQRRRDSEPPAPPSPATPPALPDETRR